jgi:hypothetical protein
MLFGTSTSSSAMVIRSPSGVKRNQVLIKLMHIQIFVKNMWKLPTDIPTSADISWMLFRRSLRTALCIRSVFRYRSQLAVARSANHHWHSHGHHENVYVNRKPAFSSLSPDIRYFRHSKCLQVICLAKHKIFFFYNWVMHPVARVSFKYWNTSVSNKSFGARFIVHFTLHVSAPIGGHLQVVYKHIKYIRGNHYIFNGSVELVRI